MYRWIIAVGIVLIIGLVVFRIFFGNSKPITPISSKIISSSPTRIVVGRSVEGRDIDAYIYGNGETHLEFIGGIHGGYEWNSVVLAYKFIDYLNDHPEVIPKNLTVTIIPSANPDGVYKVTGREGRFAIRDVALDKPTTPGRFNARTVDLNRNFDCKWQQKSTWRQSVVSGGTGPFSEPEAVAIRDFVLKDKPVAVIFWHSQSGAVYASQCKKGILPETLNIMNVYARASGYRAIPSFDSYETSGDAEGWLAVIGIPAITVELTTHETIEWEKNLAGVQALLEYYNK